MPSSLYQYIQNNVMILITTTKKPNKKTIYLTYHITIVYPCHTNTTKPWHLWHNTTTEMQNHHWNNTLTLTLHLEHHAITKICPLKPPYFLTTPPFSKNTYQTPSPPGRASLRWLWPPEPRPPPRGHVLQPPSLPGTPRYHLRPPTAAAAFVFFLFVYLTVYSFSYWK